MLLTPGGKFCNGPGVRLSGVRVANVGGEEFDKSFGRVGRRREEGGERPGARYDELYWVVHGLPLLKLVYDNVLYHTSHLWISQ